MTVEIYKIAGEELWDVERACYVFETGGKKVTPLYKGGQLADAAYLRETLEFYGLTVGDELLKDEDRAKAAREKRDELLTETDYLLMPDYPLSDEKREAVKAYRQALRDVPEQSGFPASIEWPTLELVEEA